MYCHIIKPFFGSVRKRWPSEERATCTWAKKSLELGTTSKNAWHVKCKHLNKGWQQQIPEHTHWWPWEHQTHEANIHNFFESWLSLSQRNSISGLRADSANKTWTAHDILHWSGNASNRAVNTKSPLSNNTQIVHHLSLEPKWVATQNHGWIVPLTLASHHHMLSLLVHSIFCWVGNKARTKKLPVNSEARVILDILQIRHRDHAWQECQIFSYHYKNYCQNILTQRPLAYNPSALEFRACRSELGSTRDLLWIYVGLVMLDLRSRMIFFFRGIPMIAFNLPILTFNFPTARNQASPKYHLWSPLF